MLLLVGVPGWLEFSGPGVLCAGGAMPWPGQAGFPPAASPPTVSGPTSECPRLAAAQLATSLLA